MKKVLSFLKSNANAHLGHDNWSQMEQLEPRLLLSTYYVATDGDNGAAGGPDTEWLTVSYARSNVDAGDTIIIRDGLYTNTNEMDTGDNNVTWLAENARQVTLKNSGAGRILDVLHTGNTFEGIVFDGDYRLADIIRVYNGADNTTFTNIEVLEGSYDGIDIYDADSVLIEDSEIHEMLLFDEAQGGRVDAHGIVTSAATNLVIRNTEVYYVSGDAFQAIYGSWDNILIEGCTFWNGDLPEPIATATGFPVGINPGENGIDTKVEGKSPRANITIRNTEFYGWSSDYLAIGAALNLKLKIYAIVEGNTVHDNRFAFRVRGGGGNPKDTGAHIDMFNNVIYNNSEMAIRYEDSINEFHLWNNTFGTGNVGYMVSVPSASGSGDDFQILNNLWWGTKPSVAGDASNIEVDSSDFVDSANHDYHIVSDSDAVNAGDNLYSAGVVDDFDDVARPSSGAFDSGAYEFASDDPSASITATDANAAEEGQDTGTFRVSLDEAADGDVTVNYTVTGTASSGDYEETLSGSVVISDTTSYTDITITPVDDQDEEGSETVILTLTSGTGYNVGSPGADTVTIADNDVQPSDDVADGETAVAGTVSGTYTDTISSNDTYQSITERESSGNPNNRYSYLEHQWNINVTGGSTVTFYVEAYQSTSTDGDNFLFQYYDGSWNTMVTVTKTSDDDQTQSFALPGDLSGDVSIRVVDTDQTAGNRDLDTIYIDYMYIRSE